LIRLILMKEQIESGHDFEGQTDLIKPSRAGCVCDDGIAEVFIFFLFHLGGTKSSRARKTCFSSDLQVGCTLKLRHR
jgi:hypothetical protein